MKFDIKALRRRMVEIDYRHKHRHLPGSLSALPIIVEIYEKMTKDDVFILSKGHSCSALYAALEAIGHRPNVALVHPERDPENGVTITSGSLGHGLPIGVGLAVAKAARGEPGIVHVLMGDGECEEGTVWESLIMATRFGLSEKLKVHVDFNGWKGSDRATGGLWTSMNAIYPVEAYLNKKGLGIKRFEDAPEKSVHLVTDQDYAEIMEELA